MSSKYNEHSWGDGSASLKSAQIIVPIALDLYQPKSVVDVGCGFGTFLSVFKERGIEDIFGIDGSWVKKEKLRIPQTSFQQEDLEKPIRLDRNFDLAVSLEVAEHISKDSAGIFVETLTNLAPVVLFSAAIPYQGGLHHINEQWPDYWAELFAKKGYVPIDSIRKKIWNNSDVKRWYRQNILLFVKKDFLNTNNRLMKEFEQTESTALSIVHPETYKPKVEDYSLVKRVPHTIKWLLNKWKVFRAR